MLCGTNVRFGSSVGIMTGLQARQPSIRCSIPRRSKIFLFSESCLDRMKGPPKLSFGINSHYIIIIIIYLFTAIGLLPGGSGYFTCIQNIKLVTTEFKSGGLHEKHVVTTWNVGNRLSVCL